MHAAPRHFLLAILLFGSLSAQQLPPPAPNPAVPGANDAPVELNPFVMTADADHGYAPTETLSGTRLKTQVKDVPDRKSTRLNSSH